MASVPGLSQSTLPRAPAAASQESATGRYVDEHALGLLNGDQFLDKLHAFPRLLASGNAAMTSGVVYASGLFAVVPDTASRLRIATATDALSGSGSFQVGVYTGPSSSALTRRATIAALAATAGQFYDVALSAAVSWEVSEFVAVLALPTGWTTPPRLRSIVGGGPSSAVLNPVNRYCATSASGQTALPASANLGSGWAGSGAPHWWALAA